MLDKEEAKKAEKPKAVISVTKTKAPASKKRINRTAKAVVLPKPKDKKQQ